MRICHITEAAGGGSGQVVINLARYGLSQGDEVTVVYAPKRAEAKFIAALESLPRIKLVTSSMQRAVGLHDIRDAYRLFHMLRKAGPFDIIHGHSSKAGALSRLGGLFLPGTVIYTPHAFYSMMHGTSPVWGIIERVLSWLGPCVVCVSLGEFRHGEQLGINKSKLFLIPNGTTPRFAVSREEARRNLGAGENSILFGFVGRLEPQKNPTRAIAAFAGIISSFPNAHLVMVGDGQLRAAVEAERTRLNMEKHIDLLGYCDARAVIPGLDCLIGSSEFETLPISFLECLAAGVPIVTTPVGGTDEAIVEGQTGFVARTSVSDDLAAALTRILSLSFDQRRKMAEAAHLHSAFFTAEVMGEKYRSLYKKFV